MNNVNIHFNDSVDEKIVLHDGGEVIKKITFIGIFRDSESYLSKFFFKMAEVIERIYDAELEYFFLENNS